MYYDLGVLSYFSELHSLIRHLVCTIVLVYGLECALTYSKYGSSENIFALMHIHVYVSFCDCEQCILEYN